MGQKRRQRRLPAEIMEKICEILSNDRALRTLATLQSASTSSYTLTTPFLYRHIVFDIRHAILFLDLFNEIPKSDENEFLEFGSVNSDSHLLDQKLAVQLRSFMSYTQSLTLITRATLRSYDPKDYRRLQGFDNLQNLLTPIRDRTPLWPILEGCHIDLGAWPRHSSPSSPGTEALLEMTPLVDILFDKLHPANMSIIIPNRLIDLSTRFCLEASAAFCWVSVSRLHADHIELAGLDSTGVLEYIPRASKSLTIRIDRSPPYNRDLSEDAAVPLGERLAQRAVRVLVHKNRDALHQIDDLRLIGIIRSNEITRDHSYAWLEERILAGVPNAMVDLMKERLGAGNKRDLRITIVPDTSTEDAEEAEVRERERTSALYKFLMEESPDEGNEWDFRTTIVPDTSSEDAEEAEEREIYGTSSLYKSWETVCTFKVPDVQ